MKKIIYRENTFKKLFLFHLYLVRLKDLLVLKYKGFVIQWGFKNTIILKTNKSLKKK